MSESRFNPSDPDQIPPLPQACGLGAQHMLAMFAGNVTVPIIVAFAVGASAEERVFLIQAAMIVAGFATLIQTVGIGPVGARLPIMQGTSFGFLPVCIPVAKAHGLGAVFGGAIVAGLAQIALGLALPKIRRFMPPLVGGIVVLTIGLTLLPVGLEYAAGGVPLKGKPEFGSFQNLGLAALVLALALFFRFALRGFPSAASILLAMACGYLAAAAMGMVDWGRVESAEWFAPPSPLKYGLSFPALAVVGMLVMAFVTTVETVGDISGVTMGGAKREPTARELKGGILADGVGTLLAAPLNAFPNTSYSQNVGLVGFTRVMSRHVVSIGALFLIAAGLLPKAGAVVAVMPPAVLGGAAIVMFGMIASAGIQLMAREKLDARALTVAAVSIGLGLSFQRVPEATAAFHPQIANLLKSGIVPAAVLAVFLNIVLPRENNGPAREGENK